jgi:hypothetical protein
MRIVGFNSQRDNFDFNGAFHGWQQCFSTAVWMLMSFWTDRIKFDDDTALSKYVDDVSDAVGSPGIGEKVKAEHKEIVGNTAYWWEVHRVGINTYLSAAGVSGECIHTSNARYADVIELLKNGPVVLGTDKLGGLPGGHIILAVDVAENGGIIINDPYGDANTFYKNVNGAGVIYPESLLSPHLSGNILYWKQ